MQTFTLSIGKFEIIYFQFSFKIDTKNINIHTTLKACPYYSPSCGRSKLYPSRTDVRLTGIKGYLFT